MIENFDFSLLKNSNTQLEILKLNSPILSFNF